MAKVAQFAQPISIQRAHVESSVLLQVGNHVRLLVVTHCQARTSGEHRESQAGLQPGHGVGVRLYKSIDSSSDVLSGWGVEAGRQSGVIRRLGLVGEAMVQFLHRQRGKRLGVKPTKSS